MTNAFSSVRETASSTFWIEHLLLKNLPFFWYNDRKKGGFSQYDRRMQYFRDEAPAGPVRILFFQGQGPEFPHCLLGAGAHCRGFRGFAGHWRAGSRPRHRQPDPAALSPGREGLRRGSGHPAQAPARRNCRRIFQSGDPLGGYSQAGHPRSGPGEILRPCGPWPAPTCPITSPPRC